MANSKTHSAETATKKRPSKTATKKRLAKPPAARHHTGTKHSGEFDIDLTWPCEDMSERLKGLRKILKIVIKAIEAPTKGGGFAAGYHNITVCNGSRH